MCIQSHAKNMQLVFHNKGIIQKQRSKKEMSSEVDNRSEREDDVWKFKSADGILVGSDGILYAYFKTISYVYIDEVNGVGLNDSAVKTIQDAKSAGHELYINLDSISLDYVAFLYIENDNDYLLN
jgi:hypothetical protein